MDRTRDTPGTKHPRTPPRYITDEERGRRYREAVVLAEQGMDAAEIAERVGLTVRQVEERIRYHQQHRSRGT